MSKKRDYNIFIVFLILSLIILVLGRVGFLQIPLSFFSKAVNPVREIFSTPKNISDGSQKEIDSLLTRLVDEKKLIDENNALKDQFQNSSVPTLNLLPSKVIGSPSFIPGVTIPKSLILNKGSKDGVRIGQAVISGKNIVGRISKVEINFSKADLITNPSVSVTAKTEKEALGIVKGLGNEEVILDNVILSEELKIGDMVYTKGDVDENGDGIVPDLLIGKIISVDKKSSELFQQAAVKSFSDFTKLSQLFILIP